MVNKIYLNPFKISFIVLFVNKGKNEKNKPKKVERKKAEKDMEELKHELEMVS